MIQKHKQITEEQVKVCYEKHKHLGKMADELEIPIVQVWRLCKKLDLGFVIGRNTTKKDPLEEILEGLHPYFQTGKVKKKLLQEKVFDYKCVECGISDWNGKQIVLQLDHIDGNSNNHKKSNLRFLCPNCHSQTDTWCGKNK